MVYECLLWTGGMVGEVPITTSTPEVPVPNRGCNAHCQNKGASDQTSSPAKLYRHFYSALQLCIERVGQDSLVFWKARRLQSFFRLGKSLSSWSKILVKHVRAFDGMAYLTVAVTGRTMTIGCKSTTIYFNMQIFSAFFLKNIFESRKTSHTHVFISHFFYYILFIIVI